MPNPCNWPKLCVLTAEDMLEEIGVRAQAAVDKVEIDPGVRKQILQRIVACEDPQLTNPKTGKHVCDLNLANVRAELRDIWERTAPEKLPVKVGERPKHWVTIAQDLDLFPTG